MPRIPQSNRPKRTRPLVRSTVGFVYVQKDREPPPPPAPRALFDADGFALFDVNGFRLFVWR